MVSPIPVIKMMPSINLSIPKIGREELGLPTNKFIFLFIFDFFSRLERKNPLATITAFKKAFRNSNPDVLLLIKSSNSQRFSSDKSRLINTIRDSPNIKHIDGYLSNVFEKIGIFDSDLTQLLDIDMWLRIMGNYKIAFVDQTLSELRIHPQQQTQLNLTSGKNAQDYQRFYQKILDNSVYSFLAPEVKETVRQKLGFLLKQDFAQLANLVEQYRRYPADESVLNSLRKLRRQLAEKLLGLSNEQLKYFYQAEIGEIYKLLLNSGIKNEVLTAFEKEFVANLQENFYATNILQGILVFILYRFAFQLPINYRQAVLPKWIFTDFLNFLFARPLNFQEVGELEKYCQYVKDLIVYLKGNIFSNSNLEVRQSIAAFLGDNLDLKILSCCDF